MLLRVIPMICFEFLRILEKNRKKGKPKNLGKHEPLHRSVGCLAAARLKGQKGPTSSTLRLSCATLQHSSAKPRLRHCSLRENFGFFFRKSRIRTLIV